MTSSVRELRLARGLSQSVLARAVGLTRQAIISIESGQYSPNTSVALRLARELGCKVEDLFQLPDAPVRTRVELWGVPARPGTRVAIGKVRERLVAHPLSPARPGFEGFSGADGLVAPGDAPAQADLLTTADVLERTALLLGCDPSLSLVGEHVARRAPGTRLVTLAACSRAALECVARGAAHVAGTHLPDPSSGESNLAPARQALRSTGGIVVGFASWEQGLFVAAGNPRGIRSIEDLARPDIRFINREPGSGSRCVLDDLLAIKGVPPASIPGYDRIVHGHFAVARAVASGGADAGIGLRAGAMAFGLDFVPLCPVRFDLVIPRDHVTHPAVSTMLDLLNGRALRGDLSSLPGYDTSTTGAVLERIPANPDASSRP